MVNKYLNELEMETPRSPSELAEWFKLKYEEILADPVEKQKARLHQGLYKYFIEEIYPLVLFVDWKFKNDDVLCQPKIGSQGYDAIIWLKSDPESIHNVEVTWPQNGQDYKAIAKVMNATGFHYRCGDDFRQHDFEVLGLVKNTASKKAIKDYRNHGGSTLLIVVDTSCSPVNDNERKKQLNELATEIRKISFLVESVYLIASPNADIIPVIEK
jgi:hypothetical protein